MIELYIAGPKLVGTIDGTVGEGVGAALLITGEVEDEQDAYEKFKNGSRFRAVKSGLVLSETTPA